MSGAGLEHILGEPRHFTMSMYIDKETLYKERSEYYMCRAEILENKLGEAIDRIKDMLMGDDGQAFKEARKFLDILGVEHE
jgi:hypothetical protein